jgi:hypothetical protein
MRLSLGRLHGHFISKNAGASVFARQVAMSPTRARNLSRQEAAPNFREFAARAF